MNCASPSNGSLPIHPDMKPDTIYRRFFLAAILIALSAGAAWGVALLWDVAHARSFTGVSIFSVNAHGHAQIFGWVGLFIMGFAYQALPRMWGARLVGPHLAIGTFVFMMLGLAGLTVGTWMAETSAMASTLVKIGGILQIAAVATFGGQLLVTYKRSNEPVSPAVGFMFMALLFFFVMTVMNFWHTLALIGAESAEVRLAQIATYQAALRDLQIHGLALFMILGVSMRFFPGMFGLLRTPAAQGWIALFMLTLAVVGEVALLIASQQAQSMSLRMMLISPWLMLLVGLCIIVLPWRLWRPLPKPPGGHRSTKFIRTAYLWLGISLVLLLAMPAYLAVRANAQGLESMGFSHAYYGAVRHAITVGFVSLMIMGVAAFVVPNIRGRDYRTLSALWVPFILVNVGCSLRVAMQIMTDWHDAFYSMIALSGVLELTGLGWWGIGLIAIMFRRSTSFSDVKELQGGKSSPRRDHAPKPCTCCGTAGASH